MFGPIAHIGIAVSDLEAAIAVFTKLLGRGPDHREDVADQCVRTAMFETGPTAVELLQATSPDSAIAKFIEKRGEGMHHVSYFVADIVAELKRLEQEGFQLIDRVPRKGAGGCLVAFIHPKSANGVLVELSQKVGGGHAR